MNTLVMFRGTRTECIHNDAIGHGVTHNDTLIICREGDKMRQEGDKTVTEAKVTLETASEITVVANGGTTSQLVPFLHFLFSEFEGKYTVLDLQLDGISVLASNA